MDYPLEFEMPTQKFLIRLDDACPTMKQDHWKRMEQILSHHGIQPIVAVIPANGDSALNLDPPDKSFWDLVRRWEDQGWPIAMHGCEHVKLTRDSGLVL